MSSLVKAEVIERRLTVVPHNTWRALTEPSFVSLHANSKGIVEPAGSLKILDYVLHA